jgi:PAS domain S-box-containing protein
MVEPVAVILHVDDNDAHRYAVSWRLQKAGFVVKEASTGNIGIELARTEKPNLIVLDVKLPDIGGFEVCKRLKEDPLTSAIPILHLSSHRVGSSDVVQGLEVGADGYLTEPIEPEELVATIKALLRLRESEDQARLLAEKWQATFDAIQDGICIVESNGTISQCNSAMARVVGKPTSDIIGGFYYDVIETNLGEINCQKRPTFHQMKEREEAELEIRGSWYHLACDPLFDNEKKVFGAVTILKNVTEVKQAADALDRYSQELARSNSELEHFAHIASHDLKEPLRAISNYVSLLSRTYRDHADEAARKYMEFISDGSKRMLALINDLLEFSKVGHQDLCTEKVDCNVIFDEVISNLGESLVESGGKCTRSDLPSFVFDPYQITQLLQNLVSNALKFRSESPSRIHVSATLEGDYYRFAVQDNGIGIAPEYREKIFVLFQRLHSNTTHSGTGIGLAICKKIVERNGGKIWFESLVGEGTTFYFTIPRRMGSEMTSDERRVG